MDLRDGDAVTDLGSGPYTVPIALFLSRPDLREKRLEFRCLDRTGKVLEAGAAIFEALRASSACGWKLRSIRGSLGTRIEGPKAALVTAANVFNELFWDERHPASAEGARKAPFLSALAREDGTILVVEPGIPRSGEFMSALRDACLALGRQPLAPCTHTEACPLPGGRRGAKWCHFAFDTDEAPNACGACPRPRAYRRSGPLSASCMRADRRS
jgi:ribosomal protein RSM22 (predicted rRNA methylase)